MEWNTVERAIKTYKELKREREKKKKRHLTNYLGLVDNYAHSELDQITTLRETTFSFNRFVLL